MNTIDLSNATRISTEGHTSKGNQPKWLCGGTWYKADALGYEGLSEVLVSWMLSQSNVEGFVRYSPVIISDGESHRTGCSSANFRNEDEMLVPFERIHRAYRGTGLAKALAGMSAEEAVRYTVEFIESVTGLEDVGIWLTTVLELDSFTLNEDRHTNNLAVIRNEKTGSFRLCPIFDNGLAFLSDCNDYPFEKDIYSGMASVRAKPFDRDFDVQVSAAEMLYRPRLKFSFTKQYVRRELELLEGYYTDEILQRVETLVYEQMRRYPVLFQA